MFKRLLSSVTLTTLVLLGMMIPGWSAEAQGLKVGFTDHEILLLYMPEYQQAQQTLQKEYEISQSALQSLSEDFQGALERYQKQQPLLNAESRQTREAELQQQQLDIQTAAQSKENDLAELEVSIMGPIVDQVESAINKVAKEKGLDLVLKATVGGQPLLLFVNQETVIDITPDVAKLLGIEVDESAAAAVPTN